MSKEIVEIEGCEILRETDRAVLVTDNHTTEEWVPLSMIEDRERLDEDGVLCIPEWLAVDKGFV